MDNKVIVLGDTHGRSIWKDIVEKVPFDKVIFIGDYFDTHEGITPEVQLNNFNEIVDFKFDNYPRVELLIGNHDYHYMPGIEENYSGFSTDYFYQFNQALSTHLKHMKVCTNIHNFLLSHAGITKTWCNDNNIYVPDIVNSINQAFALNKRILKFNGINVYGDDVTQSPIWVRPRSLVSDGVEGYVQVVGHTTQQKMTVIENQFILIDTLGTTEQFLYIENNEAKPKTLNDFI